MNSPGPAGDPGEGLAGGQGEAVMVLRRAVAGDLDRLVELDDLVLGTEAWPVEVWRANLADPAQHYWVTLVGGVVAGSAGIALRPSWAGIMSLAVDPAVRGHGFGRRLMERLMADAAEAGSKRVELMVQAGSVPAMTLYRSLGFAEKGLVRGYYRASGQDGIAMLAELA